MSSTLDLQPFEIQRPLKIRWLFDSHFASFLESVKSKSLRTFLKKTEVHLAAHDIQIRHTPIDSALYAKWFSHYQQQMVEKKYDIIATTGWFDQKQAEGKKVGGFFLIQNNVWVGSLIYTLQDTQKAIACFKTTVTLPEVYKKNHSLSAILDYLFVEEMLQRQIPWISLGSMRNAFGVINTLGNLDHKLRCGYFPIIKESSELVDSVPLDEKGNVAFFGQQNDQLQLFLAHPAKQPFTSELTRFESDIISIRYLPYT